ARRAPAREEVAVHARRLPSSRRRLAGRFAGVSPAARRRRDAASPAAETAARLLPSRAMVTVVIPTLNEELRVAAAVRSAFEAGASEVIVVDGGSADATVQVARDAGARVLEG